MRALIKPRALIILVGSFALTGAIATLVFWTIGRGEDAARRTATQFVSALLQDDPARAPRGGAGYVTGVREYFGDVRAARVIEVRSVRTGSRKGSRTYLFADVHLETERGPAVVELRFNGSSLIGAGEKITAMREVYPRDVDDDALSDAELVALAKAFQRRERTANDLDLSGQPVRVE